MLSASLNKTFPSFLNERLTKFVDVSGWVRTTPQSSERLSQTCSMGLRAGLLVGQSSMKSMLFVLRNFTVSIMLKNRHVGIVMEEHVIAVPLIINIAINDD